MVTWNPVDKRPLLAQTTADALTQQDSGDRDPAPELKPGAFYVANDIDVVHILDDSAHAGAAAKDAMAHKFGATGL